MLEEPLVRPRRVVVLERIVPEAAGLKASAIAGAELLYSLESNALLA